jgi:hypothetical protein
MRPDHGFHVTVLLTLDRIQRAMRHTNSRHLPVRSLIIQVECETFRAKQRYLRARDGMKG